MRRVSVKAGLKQRVGELLGNSNSPTSPLNSWSIQSAMINNLQRIVKAIVGDTESGRPMKGLWMTKISNNRFDIGSGYGFTPSGNIVVVDSNVQVVESFSATDVRYVYLKHELSVIDGDTNVAGKKTGFIGKEGLENIVADDLGATKGLSIDYSSGVIILASSPTLNDDYVFLGTVSVAEGVLSVSNTIKRGLSPNQPGTQNTVISGLVVEGDGSLENLIISIALSCESATFNGEVTFGGTVNLNGPIIVDGDAGINSDNMTSVQVRNGLVIGPGI